MLSAAGRGAQLVVCNTCRFSADAREDGEGQRGGALLAAALRDAANAEPRSGVAVVEMACLFACSRHCAVHIRAAGKISYVLGDFAPDAEAAHAILAYARHYAESEDGVVPYRSWPEGVKGHFITRQPPEGFVVT